MRLRVLAGGAILLAAVSGCTGGDDAGTSAIPTPDPSVAARLTVWLMDSSQPRSVIDLVNNQFAEAYPNVEVDVQLQQWSGIQEAMAGVMGTDAAPDVVEIGNTLTAQYADAGSLLDLTSESERLGVDAMLPGLAKAGVLDGRRYGVPYYGGDNVVVYRKSQFAKAGVSEPRTLDELEAVAGKLQAAHASVEDYSAFYFPGKYWQGALPFIWAHGGDIADEQDGTWVGGLDSPESRAGLEQLARLVDSYSAAPKDGDVRGNVEAFAKGNVGMMIDSWWVPGSVSRGDLQGDVGAFALPGLQQGASAPVYTYGSDLAVSATSQQPGLAVEWISLLTGVEAQTKLASTGVIPNQEAAFAGNQSNPFLAVADAAALNSDFTPVSPRWPNVESASVLPDMLVSIFTGRQTLDAATTSASEQVGSILNG
jgi:N,N'-diacetylchitobiose transport system substrate-binding protein